MDAEGLQINLLTALGGATSFGCLIWWLSTKFTELLLKIQDVAHSIEKIYASKDSQKIVREELLARVADVKAEHDKLELRVRNIETHPPRHQ